MITRLRLLLLFLVIVYSQNFSQEPPKLRSLTLTPKSDAIMQGFYWNSTPGGIWWDSLATLAPSLASAGFGAIWFPPSSKGAAGALSMGYDPYDHFDFGEFNQKGSVRTRFGSRQELINAIQAYHNVGIQVFADAVMGHMNGGEQKIPYECKPYPSYPDSGYLLFNYPTGSGRFRKNASHFYPNLQTCDVNPPYHGPSDPIFKFGEQLAHAQSHVKDSLIVWGEYLRNVLGFDGFRIDEVKSIDPIFVGPWLQNANAGGFAFAEYYGSVSEISTWLYYCQTVFGGDVSMLDFPLRFSLQDMCNNTSGTYDMNNLDYAGLVNAGISGYDVVTFVENHDLDRQGWDGTIDNGHNPIIYNKEMAYAYTMFSEGRPCVFYKDYFGYGLRGRIDTLLRIREKFLWGGTTKRSGLNPWYVGSLATQQEQSRDLYVARRDGGNGRPQVILVLNDNPYEWRGVWVNTNHPNQVFRDYTGVAMDKQAAGDGRVDLWAPPRGYAIYVPDTASIINHSPYVDPVPDQVAFTNTLYEYQTVAGDPNNNPLTYSLTGNPSWLSITAGGKLTGTPSSSDTTQSIVIIRVADSQGEDMKDTVLFTVRAHPVMDGAFEGSGVWSAPIMIADTLAGWDSTRARELYVTEDPIYFYFGANVKARQSMNWAFLINTKAGGGSNESWSRSIQYIHPNKPDYILRGSFGSYAEFHTWTGSSWNGVGNGLSATEFGENIASDVSTDGWVEGRVLKSAIGNPSVLGVQFYITGNQNSNATYDACPNDQNTTAPVGVTTQLRYYAIKGTKTITTCNIQFPQNATVTGGNPATIYARSFGIGVTDSSGQGAGIQAWIGYSTSNTNPSTWSDWISATFNVDVNGYDEYKANLGAGLPGATYYYASRFQYSGGNFLYGGYSTNGGGYWNGTSNVSGVLTVLAPPATPTLALPANGSTNISTLTQLSWNTTPGAMTYRLQIATDSLFASLYLNDSTLTGTSRQIGPLMTTTKYFWRVRAKNTNGTSAYSDIWSFTTSNDFTNLYDVSQYWNMISLPISVSDPRKTTVFPTAVSGAFATQPGGGYVQKDTLQHGQGYWIKFPSAQSIPLTGTVRLSDTLNVQSGWNLIGSVSYPVATGSITQFPDSVVQSLYYSFDGGYVPSSIIEPAKAYWVKTRTSGQLVLTSTSSMISSGVINESYLNHLSRLVIEDAAHHRQALYFDVATETPRKSFYEMPPPNRESTFDARYGSQRLVEIIGIDQEMRFPISIRTDAYPVTIRWSVLSQHLSSQLIIGTQVVPMTGDGSIEVMKRQSEIFLYLHSHDSRD